MSYLHASHLQRAPSLQHYFSTACAIDPQDPSCCCSCDTRKLQPHAAPSLHNYHINHRRSPTTDHSDCSCAVGHNFHASQTRKGGASLERRHVHANSGEPHAQNLIIGQQGGLLSQRSHHSQELLPRLDLTDEDLRVLATILCVDDDESATAAPSQPRNLARY